MFTGIVEELGEVVAVERHGEDAARLTVRGPLVTSDAVPGASIAVNGVCLTVVEHGKGGPGEDGLGEDGLGEGEFSADVMRETLERSSLGSLVAGDRVNLERPVTLATRLGGHLVQGHVDGVGAVLARTPGQHWEIVQISLPDALSRYVVEKGSITVDGVSLTVAEVDDISFTVSLIPTTLALTTLGRTPVGGAVNLEVDVTAKYVERLLRKDAR